MVWNLKKLWLPVVLAAMMLPACIPATAQTPPHPHPPRPPMQQEFHMHFGRWWDNPHVAKELGLSSAQQQRMNAIFQEHRGKLMELHRNLHKQEAILGPLIGADRPNESKILNQIDVVAQARANLEKEFARMLLGLQRQLTPEQWQKLKVMHQEHMERMKHQDWHHGPQSPKGPPPPPPM